MAHCLLFCLGESCTSALASMPDTPVPPHMALVPFKCWSSEGVSLSKSMYGFFKRNCLGLQLGTSSTDSIPAGFSIQKLWGLIFLALEPWAGGVGEAWCGAGTPQSQNTPPKFYLPHVGVGPACSMSPHLCPSYWSGWMWFL